MDIQAWRKHLQQVHGVHKTVLTTRFHEQAALVSMKRPCVFCCLPFQKSPNLHRSKCLPLAQLLSVQHGYAGVGGDADCGSVGAVLPDGVNGGIHTRSFTGSQGERGEDEASQVPKAGEGWRKGPDRGSQTPGGKNTGQGLADLDRCRHSFRGFAPLTHGWRPDLAHLPDLHLAWGSTQAKNTG